MKKEKFDWKMPLIWLLIIVIIGGVVYYAPSDDKVKSYQRVFNDTDQAQMSLTVPDYYNDFCIEKGYSKVIGDSIKSVTADNIIDFVCVDLT